MRDTALTDEVIDRCLNLLHELRSSDASILLLVPTKRGSLPPGFPRGERVVQTQEQEEKGQAVYRFPALKVLTWALERRNR